MRLGQPTHHPHISGRVSRDQEETADRVQEAGTPGNPHHQAGRHAATGGAGFLLAREARRSVVAAVQLITQAGLTEMGFWQVKRIIL